MPLQFPISPCFHPTAKPESPAVAEEFYRIKRLPPYVIAEVNAMRAAARAGGEDIIDLGMGNPDLPPPAHVIDKLAEVARDPSAHGYSASKGIPGLRRAQAAYYQRRFGVDVDAESEVVVTLGSKEGLANLAQAITAPGDVVLAPSPTYPIHTFGFIIAGATVRSVPTTPDERYFEALSRAMRFTVPKPSVLVMGYPSNPTAEVVDLAFYERVVAFAKEHKLWVLSDLAYSELYFDGCPTPSILQVKGAKDVAVEFTSLSKTYSMAGWRIGFAVGNKTLIAALTRVKSYLDYGAFTPIQAAAVAALNGPQDIVAQNRALYHKRRDVLVDSFGRAGWDIPSPRASMFAWAPLPTALADMGSLEFSKQLLRDAGVAVAPGVGYGEEGEGFVRIAMVENEQRLRQAARNIRKWLQAKGVNVPGVAA
jgi:alanine-synthesizing transaminase